MPERKGTQSERPPGKQKQDSSPDVDLDEGAFLEEIPAPPPARSDPGSRRPPPPLPGRSPRTAPGMGSKNPPQSINTPVGLGPSPGRAIHTPPLTSTSRSGRPGAAASAPPAGSGGGTTRLQVKTARSAPPPPPKSSPPMMGTAVAGHFPAPSRAPSITVPPATGSSPGTPSDAPQPSRAQPPPKPPARQAPAATAAFAPAAAAAPPTRIIERTPYKPPAMPKGQPQGHARPAAADAMSLRAELRMRAERLKGKEPLAAARALVELGIYEERAQHERKAARKSYESARALSKSLAPALTRLRRMLEGKPESALGLEIVGDELAVAEDESVKADLLAERARLSEIAGKLGEARRAFGEALALAPRHPASLRGLESLLRRELARAVQAPASGQTVPRLKDVGPAMLLAAHLERVSAAMSDSEARMAAWVEVERAELHDDLLDQADKARAALERAVALDPTSGPVRDALTRHLVRHGNMQALVDSLLVEADSEQDDHRAARLQYAAARMLTDKLQQPASAIAVLQKAVGRAPAGTSTRRRALLALVPLLEAAGDLAGGAEGRQLLLAETTDAESQTHENVALCDIYDSLGDPARAAEHARRALEIDPEDTATQERLDRALQRLGRHEDRVVAWVAQGNAKRPAPVRTAAFVRAAEISSRNLGRRDDALATLRAAWVIDPGNGEVFDALAGLLAPPARTEAQGDVRGARDRIELYTQAAHASRAPSRKVGLLEKVAHVWEDELSQPERALEVIERILEIEPTRQSAIMALQRTAARAGDARRLARGLVAEANLTSDKALSRRLLLRAADVLSDRVGDRDQALTLVDQATANDAGDPDVLRARFRLLDMAGRHDEARKALVALAGRDPTTAFATWVEIARLDEIKLKRPHDAVRAYQEAAKIKPRHPLPRREIARLLRRVGDWKKLCEALGELVEVSVDPVVGARLLFEIAEVQELSLGEDQAALASLEKADALVGKESSDPAILEVMERILVRRRAGVQLAALYDRWLDRQPSPEMARRLRLALAAVIGESDRKHALKALEAIFAADPTDISTMRRLEHQHRALGSHPALEAVLRAEADALGSPLGRCYALWEVAQHEDTLPPETLLGVLERIVTCAPNDAGAIESGIRVCSKLLTAAAEAAPAADGKQTAQQNAARENLRGHMIALLGARKQLTSETIARACWQLEVAALREEAAGEDGAALRGALEAYLEALSQWPESLLAARGVDRIGRRLSEPGAVVTAQLTLSKIVEVPAQRAEHLVRAAELTAQVAGAGAEQRVLGLYEEALFIDPENAAAATALTRALAGDTDRLAQRLGDALERSRVSEQIVLLGTAIGRAAMRPQPAGAGPNASIGIEAMRKVLNEAPDDVEALKAMSALLSAQQLWREAEAVLSHLADVAKDQPTAVAALFELARAHEGPLGNPNAAEATLERVLAIDPKNRSALERLYQVALARGDRNRGVSVLARLIETEPDVAKRLSYEMSLAQAMREGGDRAGAVRSLCNAIASAPNDTRAWAELAAMHSTETPDGALAYAKALQQLLEIAASRRTQPDPRWLTTLGLLEINALRKQNDGLGHLKRATELPGAPREAYLGLGRGLEAIGKNGEAINILREALSADAGTFARTTELGPALGALEAALAKEGRVEERMAVEEVRALLGEAHKERLRSFRARDLPPDAPQGMALAGSALAELLVPEAQSALVDVALAIAPVAAKALRFDLGKLGIGSRERIGARDGHPVRQLADRIAQSLGLAAYDLYLSPLWQGAARVYPGDPPAVVAPSSFGELPEPEQAFALGRLLTRAALGFTWLDELSLDAADGLLIASLRAVDPSFGDGEISSERETMTQTFLPHVQRAIGRRQRKLLESVVPTVSAGYDARPFTIGIRRTEYRTAYVLCGNLVAAIDYLRRFDAELARSKDQPRFLLEHPVTNELLRFAITSDAFAQRRRLGTVGR
jgi:tetratricopeptide (TPR) repeat protein